MPGRLFIFEGGEGSGKTTLVENVTRLLAARQVPVVATREPGGTLFAEELRATLMRKQTDSSQYPSPRAQLMSFYAARFDHIEKVILPALQAGKTVLCDRFELSSYVYQVHAQSHELQQQFKQLHHDVCELLRDYKPEYIVCDIDPVEGLKRVQSRSEEKSHFDDQDMLFHYRVYAGLIAGRKHIQDCFTFHTIDATASPEEMLTAAINIIARPNAPESTARTFGDYQKLSRGTAKYPDSGDNFVYPTLGLVSEAGEVSDKIKKLSRDHGVHKPSELDPEQRQELLKEVGDVLWYAACLATELKADLGDIANQNLQKTQNRMQRGKIHGSGDNR